MLIVATDRLSAFDVIFEQPIASKGKILTEIANFWFDKTKHIIQNHLTKIKLEEGVDSQRGGDTFRKSDCCQKAQAPSC
jgi:phosphoribosylaminoimidazole-succinocarboxamide synthase